MEKKIDFLTLYQRLFQTLSHGNMQELMDVSYEITGVPILAVDIAYNLLGAVPKNKTGDYYWDYLVEHKGYDMDMTVQLYTDGIMQSVNEKEAPYVVDWGAATEEFPKILGVIKFNCNCPWLIPVSSVFRTISATSPYQSGLYHEAVGAIR